MQERIRFYDERVLECVDRLRGEFDVAALADETWRSAKLFYIGLLVEHSQPELAETFFNSVIKRILQRSYYDNDLIFVRAAISTEYIESDPPIYRSYYPNVDGARECFARLFRDFGWSRPFADLDRDLDHVLRALDERPGRTVDAPRAEPPDPGAELGLLPEQGRLRLRRSSSTATTSCPSSFPSCTTADGRLELDTILLDPQQINVLCSLSRAYFMVDMEVPSGYVEFLRSMTPVRARSELYTMLGLGKQGKTLFFRELLHAPAPLAGRVRRGARASVGQVMLVFTLPSYPYVFKVIRDAFGPGKDTDRATVRSKFAHGEARRPRRAPRRHARVRRPRACRANASRRSCSSSCASSRRRWSPTATRS